MLRSPKIVVLSSDPSETGHLQEVLSKHAVLTYARNLSELKTLLKEGEPDVLFCSWSFQSACWKDVVEEVQQCNPELPVLVLSRTANEREWMEVLELGAFDLLIPPYGEQSLLAIVRTGSGVPVKCWHEKTTRRSRRKKLPIETPGFHGLLMPASQRDHSPEG